MNQKSCWAARDRFSCNFNEHLNNVLAHYTVSSRAKTVLFILFTPAKSLLSLLCVSEPPYLFFTSLKSIKGLVYRTMIFPNVGHRVFFQKARQSVIQNLQLCRPPVAIEKCLAEFPSALAPSLSYRSCPGKLYLQN